MWNVARILGSVVLLGWFVGAAGSQPAPEALQPAIALFEEGKWEEAVVELTRLLETGGLSQKQRSEVRMALAKTYIALKDEAKAVEVFKAMVRDDPTFDMGSLGGDEAPTDVIRYFGQAVLQVRYEDLQAQRARLMRTSRGAACLRSAVVPGWGQRYQGYTKRGYVMAGLTVGSIAYAVVSDRAYRDAQDGYVRASTGADFDRLYDEYERKGARADVALGIVAAVWVLNMIDVASQEPNIREPEGGLSLRVPATRDGVRVVYRARF